MYPIIGLSSEFITLFFEVPYFLEVNDLERPREGVPSASHRAQLHICEKPVHQLRPAILIYTTSASPLSRICHLPPER